MCLVAVLSEMKGGFLQALERRFALSHAADFLSERFLLKVGIVREVEDEGRGALCRAYSEGLVDSVVGLLAEGAGAAELAQVQARLLAEV